MLIIDSIHCNWKNQTIHLVVFDRIANWYTDSELADAIIDYNLKLIDSNLVII